MKVDLGKIIIDYDFKVECALIEFKDYPESTVACGWPFDEVLQKLPQFCLGLEGDGVTNEIRDDLVMSVNAWITHVKTLMEPSKLLAQAVREEMEHTAFNPPQVEEDIKCVICGELACLHLRGPNKNYRLYDPKLLTAAYYGRFRVSTPNKSMSPRSEIPVPGPKTPPEPDRDHQVG